MSTVTLRPDGAGDDTNWTPNTGANYAAVDEVENDADTTYVARDGTEVDDLYAIATDAALTGATISNVRVYASSKYVESGAGVLSTSPTLKLGVKSGGTEYWDAGDTITSSYADYYQDWATNPADSAAWEKADIDALQVGIRSAQTSGTGSKKRVPYVTQVWVIVTYTAGATYTLTMGSGSYSQTGQAVSLLASRKLTIGQGSHTLTGQAVSLLAGRKLVVSNGSYSLTGQAVVLLASRIISIGYGSYALTGQDVDIVYSGGGPTYTLAMGAGSYALTGQTVGLLAGRKLAVSQGGYTLTGQAVGLLASRKLSVGYGRYYLSGSSPSNQYVGAIGDSLSAGCVGAYLRNYYSAIVAAAYQWYVLTLPKTGDSVSQGIFLPGTMKTQNGANLSTIKDTLLVNLLAETPRPGICLVLGGTNDLTGLINEAAYTTAVGKLESIYRSLIANSILPVALGIPTCANATNRARVPILNALIQAKAAALSAEFGYTVPYLDTYALTDNGVDGWITGYSSDGNVHWGPVGAAVVGQAIRDYVLTPLEATFSSPNLVTADLDTGDGILWENGSMQDDANSDGIPDGGYSTQSATAWSVVTGAADVTFSLVSDPGVVDGKWWRINKAVHTVNLGIVGGGIGTTPPLTPGAVYEIGYMCKVASLGAATLASIYFYNTADSAQQFWQQFDDLAVQVAPYKVQRKFIAPANGTFLKLYVSIQGGTADLYIGQMTIRRLS